MFDFGGDWESVVDLGQHTIDKIFESIRLKRQKFHSPDFAKFDENWLLLTNHQDPIRHPITAALMREKLAAAEPRFSEIIGSEFDRIYVLVGAACIKFEKGKFDVNLDPNYA